MAVELQFFERGGFGSFTERNKNLYQKRQDHRLFTEQNQNTKLLLSARLFSQQRKCQHKDDCRPFFLVRQDMVSWIVVLFSRSAISSPRI